MADAQAGGHFFERGVGVVFDVGLEFLGIQLAPFPPTGFWGERIRLGGGQITIDRALRQGEAPGRLGLGTAGLNKINDPFPQIQRISFHAPTLSACVPM